MPPEERGGGPPPSSCSLTFSLDGRRVSPLVLGFHGGGGARAPPRLDLSLYLSLFLCSVLLPFHRFVYIWRSVTPIAPKPSPCFFNQKLAFLRPKKGINRLTGGPRGSGARPGGWGAPPASCLPRAPSRIDFPSHIPRLFQK